MNADNFLKKNSVEIGQLIELKSDKNYKGNVVNTKDNILALKLSNGYNIGIDVSKIKSIKKLSQVKKVGKAEKKKFEIKKGLPTISILHTGGTIASRVDYRTGGVVSAFDPEDLVTMFPELAEIANIQSDLIANMWSDDLRFDHFGIIAKAIEKEVNAGSQGAIIGMGTDNLAVAACAMAFVLEELPIPVIFVGAQRSSDRGSSDAAMNMICAARFITESDFSGVAICMHSSTNDDCCDILPACKTRKMHTSARNAFKAINDTPIARVDYRNNKIEFIKKDYAKKNPEIKLVIKNKFEEKTGILKIHINMFPEQFAFYRKEKYKGLVIEGTGLGQTPGHVPTEHCKVHKKIFDEIEALSKDCVVVMTSGCIKGRVNMNVYDKARDLQERSVIPGEDMFSETAFVKLAWLLSNYKKEKVKELISKNLRGEITERTI